MKVGRATPGEWEGARLSVVNGRSCGQKLPTNYKKRVVYDDDDNNGGSAQQPSGCFLRKPGEMVYPL